MTKKPCWFLALPLATAAVAQTGVRIAAPVRNGAVVANVGWTVDTETGEDVLRGSIAYSPNSKSEEASCQSIRFLQVARVERSTDVDYDWKDGEVNRNRMRTSADLSGGVKRGYFVDHDAFKCSLGEPCSPYFRDYWPNPGESQDGFLDGHSSTKASLVDYPFGWENFENISLESCARCADDGRFLACVEWGGQWPGRGDRSLFPIRVYDQPSPTFVDALRRFNLFYSNSNKLASIGEKESRLPGGN